MLASVGQGNDDYRATGDVVVGVDIGTTGAKAVVLDAAGTVCAEAGEEYPTRFVEPNGAEQDPEDWWAATVRCVRTALVRAQIPATQVAAVGISSQAPSIVVLGADGEPVCPALLWLDRRGQPACAARRHDNDLVVAATGNRLDAYFAAPKLTWLLEAEPHVRDAGKAVVMANGYVVRKLTGVTVCDTGHAGLTLLADLDTGTWSYDLAELWGIPPEWLPPTESPTTVVGRVSGEASRMTGLLTGTPVVAGVVDGAAASLEAGLAQHGDVCEMTGQSTVVNAAVDAGRLRRDALGTLSVLPHPLPGLHIVYGSMVATGGILRWFRDEFGGAFDELDALAGTAEPGSGGLLLLPYFLGERSPIWDPDARGALVGLSMATTRADVVRAIFEGTAYGLAHNLEELDKVGVRPAVLRVLGGGAKGTTWNQIKADVTALPVVIPDQARGAPVGAGLVAAAGVKLIPDLGSEVRRRGEWTQRLEPDPARHETYRRYVEAYRELYPALCRTYERLADLRRHSVAP